MKYHRLRRIWTKVIHDRLPDGSLELNWQESEWYWYWGPVAEAKDNPILDQDYFRFYEPGTESGSTAIAAQDTNITRGTGTGNAFQVRFLIQETNATQKPSANYKLKVSKNSGAYNDVNASSSNVRSVDDPDLTDDELTTSRLTGGTGSFKDGRVDDADGLLDSAINILASEHTEMLFSVYIVDADVADSDTLDFRVYEDDDTALDNYDAVPRATVSKGATQKTVTVSLDSALQDEKTVAGSLDAALQDSFSASANIDAALADTISVEASLGAVLQGTVNPQASLDAALLQSLASQASLDAGLQATLTSQASVSAALAQGQSVAASIDASLTVSLIQRGQRAWLDSATDVNSLTGAAAENAGYTLDLSGGNAYLIIQSECEGVAGFPVSISSGLLEFRINGGAWNDLTTGTSGARVNNTHACTSSDAAVVNNRLTTATSGFLNSTFDNNGVHAGRTFNSLSHTEFATAVEFIAADLSDSDTLEFRLKDAQDWDNVIVITADIAAAVTVDASLDAAIEAQKTIAASINAALQKTDSVTANIAAALLAEQTADASLNAALLALATATAQLDAVAQAGKTGNANIDAALMAAQTASLSLQAVVRQLKTTTASLDAQISGGTAVSAQLDAVLQAAKSLSAALDAAIAAQQTIAAGLNAGLSAEQLISASLAAALENTLTTAASLDASITGAAVLTVSADLDAALQALRSATASISAALVITQSVSLALDAGLARIGTAPADLQGILASRVTAAATTNAAILASLTKTASLDAVLGVVIAPSTRRTVSAYGGRGVRAYGGRTVQ